MLVRTGGLGYASRPAHRAATSVRIIEYLAVDEVWMCLLSERI
jgi:hypothetical protein